MDQHAPYSRSDVAVSSDPTLDAHPTWGDGDRGWAGRIEPTFVLLSWLACLAVTAVLAVLGALVAAAASPEPLFGSTNTELGLLTIVAAMATFIGFATTMTWALSRVQHDRLTNSLAVAALHVAVAALLFLGELVGRSAFDGGASSAFTGSWTETVGNVFSVLERSAAAAIVACMLAVGMIPARGDRPRGTQTDVTPTDRQM